MNEPAQLLSHRGEAARAAQGSHGMALAPLIPYLDTAGSPRVVVRIGREGHTWHAVASIETPGGPILVHARADQRVILRALLRSPRFRQWADHMAQRWLPPGALDRLVATVGWSLPNPIRAIEKLGEGAVKPLRKTVEDITHAQVLRDVTHKVAQMALHNPVLSQATGLFHMAEHQVQAALRTVTNNPLWDMARTGASFIPGVGSAVSSGMAAAAAVGRGESATNIVLAAARGALPGGPLVQSAWDIGVGLAKNPHLDATALQIAQNQLANLIGDRLGAPAGAIARQAMSGEGDPWVGFYQNVQVRRSLGGATLPVPASALQTLQSSFKTGFMLARTKGRPPNPSNLLALKRSLPRTSAGEKIGRIASRAMVHSHYRTKAVAAYQSALALVTKLERRDARAHRDLRQMMSQAAHGHPQSRVALAVLDVVRRSKPLPRAMAAAAPKAALPSAVHGM